MPETVLSSAPAPAPSSTQAGATSENASASGQPASTQTSAPEWHQHIPQELRTEKTWEKYKDLPSALKSLHHAEKKIGSSLQVPTDKSTPEEIAAFREKLGVPKDPKEYKYDVKLPNDGKWDEASLGGFSDVAHKAGLTPAQHRAMLEYVSGQLGAVNEASAKAYTEAETALKAEWGDKYQANLESVGAGLAAHDPKGEVKALLNEKGLGNHPAILRFMHSIGSEVGEDKIVNGSREAEMTKEEAEAKIEAIKNDSSHPVNNKKDPKHKEAIKEYEQLLAAAVK